MRTTILSCLVAAACVSCRLSFNDIKTRVMIHSGEVFVLEDGDGSRVLVSPGLNGRILTSTVGKVQSVGFVSLPDVELGDRDAPFNNFGGQDRFWIGPEAGQFGIYFPPGGEVTRDAWRVPADLNKGWMDVVTRPDENGAGRIVLQRDMKLVNYIGTTFSVRVKREIGLVRADRLNEEIGTPLPPGVSYVGSYSLNTLTNTGEEAWKKETGLLCTWVLGQFNASPRATVIAPFNTRDDDDARLGPRYNASYFGEVPASRLTTLGNAVLFRGDASGEGKFGISPARSPGVAGAYDPERDLLIVVKFDVAPEEPHYASFLWGKELEDSWGGDVFQSYNAGGSEPGKLNEKWPFYELESVAPCKELAPGEQIVHRHATFCFSGPREQLDVISREVLGVRLDAVLSALP